MNENNNKYDRIIRSNQNITPTDGKSVILPKPYKKRTYEDIILESGFAGSVFVYTMLCIASALLNILSLGFLVPITLVWKKKYIINNTYVDGRRLEFSGSAGDKYGVILAKTWLAIVTLGFMGAHHKMIIEAWSTEHTMYADTVGQPNIAPSVFTGDAGAYFKLRAKGIALSIVTFGILYPKMKLESYKYLASHRYINGRALSLETTSLYGASVGVFALGIASAGFGFVAGHALYYKYIARYMHSTNEVYDKDSVLDAGLDFEYVEAFNTKPFDMMGYANVTAEINDKSIQEVAEVLNPKLNWINSNIDKAKNDKDNYVQVQPKFFKGGGSVASLALVFTVVLIICAFAFCMPMMSSTTPIFSDILVTNSRHKQYYINENAYMALKEGNNDIKIADYRHAHDREDDVDVENYLFSSKDDDANPFNMATKCVGFVGLWSDDAEYSVGNNYGGYGINIVNISENGQDTLTSIKLGSNVRILRINGEGALRDIKTNKILEIIDIRNVDSLNTLNFTDTSAVYVNVEGAKALTSLELPTSTKVANIVDCESIREIVVPEGVKSLTLSNCPLVTSITLPSTLESLSLDNVGNIESFTLPDSVKSLSLNDVGGIKELVIGENIEKLNIGHLSDIENIVVKSDINIKENIAFYEFHSLKELTIPYIGKSEIEPTTLYELIGDLALEKITVTGSYPLVEGVFENNENLKEVVIENITDRISSKAFNNCTNLESVTISGNNRLETIGDYAFSNCEKLKNVVLPSVVNIGEDAFKYCNSLETISFDSALRTVGDGAFHSCVALRSISLQDGVTTIGQSAFFGCESLTEINLPSTIEAIGDNAFYNSGMERISLKNTAVSKLGKSAFAMCENLKEVELNDNLFEIDEYAFEDCVSLYNIVLPRSLTTINTGAFAGCNNLLDVTIPHSVSSMESTAFSNANMIIHVEGYSARPSGWNSSWAGGIIIWDSQNNDMASDGYIYKTINNIRYKIKNHATLIRQHNNLNGEVVIPSSIIYNGKEYSVTDVDAYAFIDCKSLKKIVLPDSITNIGRGVFIDCDQLADLTVPFAGSSMTQDRLSYIFSDRYNKFHKPVGLKKVTVTKDTELPRAFEDFDMIESLSVNGDLQAWACSECTALRELIIGKNVGFIDETALSRCANIESITIDPANTSYKTIDGMILDISGKTLVLGNQIGTIPDSVEIIGSYAFYNRKAITRLTIPSNVRVIGTSAFISCSNVTELELAEGVTEIGNDAFYSLENITEVIIPTTVEKIMNRAFGYNTSLKSAFIPSSVKTVEHDIFYYDRNLTIASDASSKPVGWDTEWNAIIDKITSGSVKEKYYAPVIWNAQNNEIAEDGAYYVTINDIKYRLRDNVATITMQNTDLAGDIVIPSSVQYKGKTYSVTSMYQYAFKDSKITSIKLPNTIDTIPYQAFDGCVELTSFMIPNSVTNIQSHAFYECSSLRTIIIPSSVTTMGQLVFSGDNGLIVYVESDHVPSGWDIHWDHTFNSFGYTCELDHIVMDYKNVEDEYYIAPNGLKYWMVEDLFIVDGEEKVMTIAFLIHQDHSISGDIVIPETVTFKGKECPVGLYYSEVFADNTDITSIYIPDTIKDMKEDMFSGCNENLVIKLEADAAPSDWPTYWHSLNGSGELLAKVVYGVKLA